MFIINNLNRVVNSSFPVILFFVTIVVVPQNSAQDLVGHWKMDEGSNNTILVDASGTGNNGSILGGPSWAMGQDGLAIDLNGSNQYATVPDVASLDITDEITLAAWIKTSHHNSTQRIIRKPTGSTGYDLFLSQNSPYRVSIRLNGSNSFRIDSDTPYPINGDWMHVAATYDGTDMKLYINGVQEGGTSTGPSSIGVNSTALSIGATATGGNDFTGLIDDARVYNYALDATEILALATAPTSISLQDGLMVDGSSYTGTSDTHVDQAVSTMNYGSLTEMTSDFGVNGANEKRSLVRFNPLSTSLSGKNITSAYLAFYISNEGKGFKMHRVSDGTGLPNNWVETSVTWATKPGEEASEVARWPGENGYQDNYIYVNVPASTIQGWVDGTFDNNGWSIIATDVPLTNGDGQRLRTRNWGTLTQRPKLVVFYSNTSAPDAPTNINISASSHGQIHLTWNDNSNNESSFEIERSISVSGPEAAFTLLASVGANSTSYDDFNLAPNTEHFYRVSAKNGAGTSNTTGDGNSATTPAEGVYALEFNGSTDYVTFGSAIGTATGLGAVNFTLECWFKRTGTGDQVSTGTGGVLAIPLISKGRGEGDGTNLDMNYFLGINNNAGNATLNVLAVDFEDNGGAPNNHAYYGVTPIVNGVWYHVAATYDGTWRLYLNGLLEGTPLAVGETPRSDCVQHAGIGTAMTSTGATDGFFQGEIDEVRIWNVARTGTEILNNKDVEISTPQTNLIGRWGLNEGTTLFVNDASGRNHVGTITGGGTTWIENPLSLPVELISFEAVVVGEKIKLKWRTETELNNLGFEVERQVGSRQSTVGNWEDIGFVDGYGNSNSPKDYSFIDANLTGGTTFSYRLKQMDNDGTYEYSDIVEVEFAPTEFALYQNYPNPFNPTTKIKYSIPTESIVTIKVFNILGKEVGTLISEKQEHGNYEIDFDGSNLASGIYLYKLQAGTFSQTKKMMILR